MVGWRVTMIIVEMKITPMMAITTTMMAALIMKCLHNKIMIEGRSTIIIIITRWAGGTVHHHNDNCYNEYTLMMTIMIITRLVGGTVQVFSSPLLFLVVWPSRTELCCRFKKTVVVCDHHLVLSIRTWWSILILICPPTLVANWWNPPLPGRP